MTAVRRIPARTPWAAVLAYSRAVVHGEHVCVSGTLPVDAEGALVGGDDAYEQARAVLGLVAAALAEAGASLADVVRLRVYLRDYGDLPAVARAQREAFAEVRPACTVVQAGLVRPELRVQMDADAWLGRAPASPAARR